MTAVHVAEVQLHLYDGKGDYTDMGDAGCAIVATAGTPPTFRLGCYRADEYLCTAEITSSNDTGLALALQGQGYVSFRDDQGRLWSMHFATDEEAFELAAHVATAMYGASNMPDNRIICCDVAQGKRDRQVYGSDRIKVRFQSWVLTREGGMPSLGSRLEGNEHDDKPYAFDVPANHNSVGRDMLGFEGMTVGMAEESRRLIVVPQAAKRGRGPAVHAVYMMYVVKKKDSDFDSANHGGRRRADSSHRDPEPAAAAPAPPQAPQPQMSPFPGGTVVIAPTGQLAPLVQQAPQPETRAVAPAPAAPAPAERPAYIEQPPQALPPPPPAGFSYEQMETLERLRDQVGQMMTQIREATGHVDLFAHDFRQHDRKTKPPTLIAAQMDHSLRTLIEETDELKSELTKRDETLNGLEERNKQLQAKADRFAKTAAQLTDERKSTVAQSGETKIDLDQQMLSLQARLTRVLADREDVGRHLATVKRLLEISDKDTREAKQQLQVAEVQLSTNQAKLASTDEALQEERARRKLLEAKVVTLGDEIRAVMDEFRTKDSSIDDRRRQMNAAKLHWQQLMDDERGQAADELRELRQELVDELAVRDRRYQEERVRVAKESFERGRHQGIEDGEKAELLEGDMKMQTLQFDSQRHRSELETVRIQLRQVHEQAATDRRRLEAQIAALTRVVDDLDSQNQTMETELHSLEAAKDTVAAAAYDDTKAVLMQLTRAIGKKDLLTLIHRIRVKNDPDFNFEAVRSEEQVAAIEHERRETTSWVRRCLTADADGHNAFELPPAMRLLAPQDPPAPEAPTVAADPDPQEPNQDPDAAPLAVLNAEPSVNLAEVERRQKELLAALHDNNPALELAPPPRDPTPTPPRSPTPEPEQEEEDEEPVEGPAGHAAAADDEAPSAAPAHEHGDNDSDVDEVGGNEAPAADDAAGASSSVADGDEPSGAEAEETVPAPAARPADPTDSDEDEAVAAPRQAAPAPAADTTDDESDATPAMAPAKPPPKRPAPKPSGLFANSDGDDSDGDGGAGPLAPAVAPTKKAKAPPPRSTFLDTEDEDSTPAFRPQPAAKAPAAAPAKKATAPAAAARHKALFAASDSESDDAAPAPVAQKRAPAAGAAGKRAPPSAGLFGGGDSDDDDSDAGLARAPAVLPTTKKAPAAAPGKRPLMFAGSDDDDDDDDGPLIMPKRPAAGAASKKRPAPAPKRSTLFDSESE